MNDLTKQPNIGKVLAEKLVQAGINNINELKAVGSENAFLRIRAFDEGACLSMLFALEGAVEGIRWHDLSASKKLELRHFKKSIRK